MNKSDGYADVTRNLIIGYIDQQAADQAEIARLQAQIAKLQAENTDLHAKMEKLTKENHLVAENAKLKAENVNLKGENMVLEDENLNLKAKNTRILAKNAGLYAKVQELKEEVKKEVHKKDILELVYEIQHDQNTQLQKFKTLSLKKEKELQHIVAELCNQITELKKVVLVFAGENISLMANYEAEAAVLKVEHEKLLSKWTEMLSGRRGHRSFEK